VRRRPYQVVLFDEVEKAHPGRVQRAAAGARRRPLTDGQGRTVDFRNTLIIMTSNLGASSWSTCRKAGRRRCATR
jgi:ATP-dependent Clp protease ATP-binding subunit ClpB